MRRLLTFLLGAVVGAGGMYAGFMYHVVRTSSQVLVVPRQRPSLDDVYVDVRDWTLDDWTAHPDLVDDMVAAGHEDLVPAATGGGLLRDWLRNLRKRDSRDPTE